MSNANRKPFNKLYRNVLSSAKPPEEKGLGSRTVGRTEAREVTVTPEILEEIYNEQNGLSALSGVPLNLEFLYIPNHPMAPSVDRIDDKLGYTRDNIWIVLRFENKGRGSSSVNDAVQAIRAIKAADYDLDNWYFPDVPYDVIFTDPIETIILDEEYGYIKILRAPMGVGKTYSTYNKLIPELILKKDVDLFYYFAPNLENIELAEFEDYIMNWMMMDEYKEMYSNTKWKIITVGGKLGSNWSEVQEYIRRGFKVIVCSTDSSFSNILKNKNGDVLDYLRSLGNKFALIRDEVHYGSTTDPILTKDNTGTYNPNFKARMFTLMDYFVDTTPWIFGLTATPTKEMLNVSFGTDKYRIMNPWVLPTQTTGRTAWVGKIHQTLDLKKYEDDDYLKSSIRKLIFNVCSRSNTIQKLVESNADTYPILWELKTKTTGLIKVDITTEKARKLNHKAYLDRVLRLINEIQLPDDFYYIVTTDSGWQEYDSNGNVTDNSGEGNGWLALMNDDNSKARLLIVVSKGDKGINIPSLTDGLIFRNPTPRDKSIGKWIVRNALQLFGRFVRKNWGGLTLEQLNSLPYNLSYEILSQLNTFEIEVPKSSQWKQTVEEFLHPTEGYAIEAAYVLGGWPYRRKVAA